MTKTVMVTGGAGMIGSNFCNFLLRTTNYKIIIVDDLSGGYIENVPIGNPRVRFMQANVGTMDGTAFTTNEISIVYAFHAYAAENLSPFIRKFNYRNNVESMANLINLCIKYKVDRIVFTSSIAVYGHGEPPFTEDMIPRPNDPYGIGKYAIEMDLRVAGEQHGLDYCIVRPYNVYGPFQNIKDKFRNVLGIWMNQYLNAEPLTIFGDGQQVRNFTYVESIMKPLLIAGESAHASKGIFNIGSAVGYNINKASNVVRTVIGGGEVIHLPSRHEVKVAFCDSQLARTYLSYRDEYSLFDGVREMWDWVVQNKDRDQKPHPPIELSEGLYESWKDNTTDNNRKQEEGRGANIGI